jgi:hypothetical protein
LALRKTEWKGPITPTSNVENAAPSVEIARIRYVPGTLKLTLVITWTESVAVAVNAAVARRVMV